ncbi:MAG: glycosyltransferase, partial [Nocardioides sp.]
MSSPIVAALVVTHDGARWLPQVIEGLREQRRRPDHLVFVDTGSRDESVQLASAIVGEAAVVRLPGSTGFPQAVAAGLEHLRATGVEP